MEDQQIIKLYWQRSESAIAETEKKYGGYCQTIAYNILYDHEDARECVNDTWLHAWNVMPPKKPQRLAAFLGKITRNLSLDRYRERNRKKRGGGETEILLSELAQCVPSYDNVSREADHAALVACINRFLERLPKEKRRVFLLRYWYGAPVKKISEETGLSENKITSLLFRLRKKLKAFLEQEEIIL